MSINTLSHVRHWLRCAVFSSFPTECPAASELSLVDSCMVSRSTRLPSFIMIVPLALWALSASVVYGAQSDSRFPARISNRRFAPRGSAPALSARGLSGSVTAYWNDQSELLSPVTVDGTTYDVVLDTGSADFWLFCANASSGASTGRPTYNPSPEKELNGGTFNIKYGQGFATGSVYMDSATVGSISVKNQAIGCASSVDSQDAGDKNMDGLMGLAFNSGSTKVNNGYTNPTSATANPPNTVTTLTAGVPNKQNVKDPQMTFVENGISDYTQKLFSVDLQPLNAPTNGTYTFGDIPSSFTSPLTYMPVINFNQWIVQVSGWALGTNPTNQTSWKALIDTGTTNILVPQNVAAAYWGMVDGAVAGASGTWTYPCQANLPSFTVTFTPPTTSTSATYPKNPAGSTSTGTYNAIIPGSVIGPNNVVTGGGGSMCQGGISVVSGNSAGAWDIILGDTFLTSQLVVFDLYNVNGSQDPSVPARGQIGFGPKAGGSNSSGSSSGSSTNPSSSPSSSSSSSGSSPSGASSSGGSSSSAPSTTAAGGAFPSYTGQVNSVPGS